jgi:hypothetical protein
MMMFSLCCVVNTRIDKQEEEEEITTSTIMISIHTGTAVRVNEQKERLDPHSG